MQSILQKIYPYNQDKLITEIMNLYNKQGFVISNFIYFAIIKQYKLFEETKKTTLEKEYKKTILKGDFLLPDGIALQIFYRLASKQFNLPVQNLSNLNGTDFIPYFLNSIKKNYGSNRLRVYLYGAKPEIVHEVQKILEHKGFQIEFVHDGYSELDWSKVTTPKDIENPIKVLLIARSTPNNPIQELWTQKNFSKIKENNFIVFTVGGLFDFIAAEGKGTVKKGTQKRAPKFIRQMKLERLWRFVTDPKRNYQKVKNSFSLFPYIFKYLLLKKE